jgi:hypothetical protein
MRNPQDNIWGIWTSDNSTRIIWDNLQVALAKHGYELDIVYYDPAYPITGKYSTVIDAAG